MMKLSAIEEQKISEWNEKQSGEISVIRKVSSGDSRNEAFKEFCETLTRCAPKIRILTRSSEEGEFPRIEINPRLNYQAIPHGAELEPFLDALTWNAIPSLVQLPAVHQDLLTQMDVTAMLKLYIAVQCPFCPAMVRQMIPLTIAGNSIKLFIIDGTLFPELTEKDAIRSAPTLIADTFRWTGQPSVTEILNTLVRRDLSLLSASSLENIIKEGSAGKLAAMMLEKGEIFPAFLDLLIHEQWSVRLGAMVVMETVIEDDRMVAAQGLMPLYRKLPEFSDSVKGDLIHIFGETGSPEFLPQIEAIATGSENEELREAAQEAMERIVHSNS